MNVLETMAYNRGVTSVQEFAVEAADKLDEMAATEVEHARVKMLRDFADVLPMLKAPLIPAEPIEDPDADA